MKEILGNNLEQVFNSEINGKRTYKGNKYEVWELSNEAFDELCNMPEKKFTELAGEDAWWRSSDESNQGVPNSKYVINGKEIIAWDGYRRCEFYDECCEDCDDRTNGECEASDEDIECCCGARKYKTLSDYFCDEIGASQPRNVCALAVDLAKYNGITMGELFTKYEG